MGNLFLSFQQFSASLKDLAGLYKKKISYILVIDYLLECLSDNFYFLWLLVSYAIHL